jgi:hypothetical protein
MTKPMMSQNTREFIVAARDHLKQMRAAVIYELASDIRAGRSDSGAARWTAESLPLKNSRDT